MLITENVHFCAVAKKIKLFYVLIMIKEIDENYESIYEQE